MSMVNRAINGTMGMSITVYAITQRVNGYVSKNLNEYE